MKNTHIFCMKFIHRSTTHYAHADIGLLWIVEPNIHRFFITRNGNKTGKNCSVMKTSRGVISTLCFKTFFFYCTKSPVFVYSFWHGVCASDILVRMWRSIIRRPHKCWVPSWVEVHRNLDFIRNYKLLWSMQCYKLMTCCVWVWSLDWVHSSQRSRLDLFFVVVYWFVLFSPSKHCPIMPIVYCLSFIWLSMRLSYIRRALVCKNGLLYFTGETFAVTRMW